MSRVSGEEVKPHVKILSLDSSSVRSLIARNGGRAKHRSPRNAGMLMGWLIAGLLLLLAAIGLAIGAAGDGIVPGDVAIARAVQKPASEEMDAIASFASRVGDDFPAMVVLAIIGVVLLTSIGRRDLALFLGVAASLRALGPGLKFVANSPRPTIESVTVLAQSDGLGFPSGHAMGAGLFYGAVAVIAPQVTGNRLVTGVIQIGAFVAMGLIALSRVRLGVHWPTDVVGGLLFGLAIVCLLQAALLGWQRDRLRP